jgi:hypothetical protein
MQRFSSIQQLTVCKASLAHPALRYCSALTLRSEVKQQTHTQSHRTNAPLRQTLVKAV